jgi:hypothetical protein
MNKNNINIIRLLLTIILIFQIYQCIEIWDTKKTIGFWVREIKAEIKKQK